MSDDEDETDRQLGGYRVRCDSCDRPVSAAANYCPWCGVGRTADYSQDQEMVEIDHESLDEPLTLPPLTVGDIEGGVDPSRVAFIRVLEALHDKQVQREREFIKEKMDEMLPEGYELTYDE